ncbi:hypothetical protein AYR66_03135 [Noviherbaspirillum denitrificans]|uniref:CoA transferase n=1 Tax=Noviherbaspirillum denitrificans TaxID=1968433 RepID=A0A254T6D8_9BURK|nr:hypothetical protein AYR66_03135 [Noviherbaspirillum denitrificans]
MPGGELVTGGSPRYQVYRTSDGRFVAAGPLEDKFWSNFIDAIEAPRELLDDSKDPAGVRAAVAAIIGGKPASHWRARFAGKDVCSVIVASMQEAMQDEHFRARGLFARELESNGRRTTALPVPVSTEFRADAIGATYPKLGEANRDFGFD